MGQIPKTLWYPLKSWELKHVEAMVKKNMAGRASTRTVSREDPSKPGNHADSVGWHTLGACGEFVVARVLSGTWNEHKYAMMKKYGDVIVNGYSVDVRTANPKYETPLLKVNRYDDDNRPIVLVNAHHQPWYEVVGWIYGKDAKQPTWLKYDGQGQSREFYLVPDLPGIGLRPIWELLNILEGL